MIQWAIGLLVLVLFSGCVKQAPESELLSLMKVGSEEVDSSEEAGETVFDAFTLLKMGEAHYVKEAYTEAADAYKRFLKLYPRHAMSDFAWYRLGMSYNLQLFAHKRNMAPLESALSAFEMLENDFPESTYAPEARKKIEALNARRAQEHLDIGLFYYKKREYPAAIARFEGAQLSQLHGPIAEKALYYTVLSYDASGNAQAAKTAAALLFEMYPDTSYKKDHAVQRVAASPIR